METVAFYSYKGGVGRTLLVANTAQFLAMAGHRVVALDFDLEAPGLHQKLANPDTLKRAKSGKLVGAVDELLYTLEGDSEKHNLRQTAVEVNLPSGTNGSLFLIPAGSAPSSAYWTAFERLNHSLRANRRDGGLLEAVLELQARIAEEFAPDFLLIDSRTGITELGGLATSILADRVICLTTTAPESLEGTQVVSDALRTAPRLASQKPLRIEFLITRVVAGATESTSVARFIEEAGGSVAELPHDDGIAVEEQVLSGWRLDRSDSWGDDADKGPVLFSATLDWIAKMFPSRQEDAERARLRMQAVHRVWQDLTRSWQRVAGGTGSRPAWPIDQLRERVRFEKDKKARQADIVAYDRSAEERGAKPLMVIEYVDVEDGEAVAKWWFSQTKASVVAVLSENMERRLYSREHSWNSNPRHSDRWDLPLPLDFEALPDPTDVSIDALLGAVRRGHPDYLKRIVTEWVHCSASGLDGGAPWKPRIAKKIVDQLAEVDDIELARRVLWKTSGDAIHRGHWMGDGDDSYPIEQVIAELFAPLLWRLPPEASIEVIKQSHRGKMMHGSPAGLMAIALLARDTLGLRYDPDATFRQEGQRILDKSVRNSKADDDRGLYGLSSAFRHTEISFEISTDLPPLANPVVEEGEESQPVDIARLVSERIAAGSLVTTGLLGDYQPQAGRVILYEAAISHCADKLALRARHVGSVTLIHETLHALAHLGRDLDGRMWTEFALPDASSPLFEPSWFHETLTQYFTYRHLVRLGDPALLHAFEAMSDKQAPAYRNWRRLRDLPIEDARSWFMSVRRGTGMLASPSHSLFVF